MDAGVIVAAFSLVDAYSSEDAAIPAAMLLFLLWARNWSLNGETRHLKTIAGMVATLAFAWVTHIGVMNDLVFGQIEEATAPTSHSPKLDKAVLAELYPYHDTLKQDNMEEHRNKVEAEISLYDQTQRYKREDARLKQEEECFSKHKSGSREIRDCLIKARQMDIEDMLTAEKLPQL